MEMKTKRILSVLITVVMLIGMLPTTAFATEGTITYDLWVGGVQVTSDNTTIDSIDDANITNGSATFDPITNTLTLENFVYSGKGSCATESVFGYIYNAAIVAKENLNIVLKGTNSIDANQGDDSTIKSCYDIYAIKDVNISDADGNTSADMLTISATSYAIYSEEGNLTVKDTKIEVTKATDGLYSYNGSVSVDNAEISMTDVSSGFVVETTLEVLNNSVINITASNNTLYLYNGTVTIENSEFISNKHNRLFNGVISLSFVPTIAVDAILLLHNSAFQYALLSILSSIIFVPSVKIQGIP